MRQTVHHLQRNVVIVLVGLVGPIVVAILIGDNDGGRRRRWRRLHRADYLQIVAKQIAVHQLLQMLLRRCRCIRIGHIRRCRQLLIIHFYFILPSISVTRLHAGQSPEMRTFSSIYLNGSNFSLQFGRMRVSTKFWYCVCLVPCRPGPNVHDDLLSITFTFTRCLLVRTALSTSHTPLRAANFR